MDPTYTVLPDFMNDIDFEPMLPNSSQFPDISNQYQFNQLSPDLDFLSNQFSIPPEPESGNLVPPISVSTEGESFNPNGGSFSGPTTVSPGVDSPSSDDIDFSETVFKYVNQMLLEENVEQMPIMFHDPLGLRVTEKSFYDVLGQQYPFSPNQQPQQPQQPQQQQKPLYVDQPNGQLRYVDQKVESPDDYFAGSSSDFNASSSSPSTGSSNSADYQSRGESGEQKPSFSQTSLSSDSVNHSNSNSQLSLPLTNSLSTFGDGMSESSVNQFLAQNIFTDSESVLQFQRGVEEASKFLPKVNPLVIDLESSRVSPEVKGHASTVVVKKEKSERKTSPSKRRGRRNSPNGSMERKKSPNGSKGRKNHKREDVDSEGRSSKQSAVFKEEVEEEEELSELFDKVLLCTDGVNQSSCGSCGDNVDVKNEESKNLQPNGQPLASNGEGGKARAKKQGKKKETVDLRNLLILCAQAVSVNDYRTSAELLKQIRQHSSPFGDGSQRLAHFFANGLEARMAGTGTGTQIFYTSLASKKTSAVEILKSYQVSLASCPFKRMSMFFKNKMIFKMAEKATTLHIVDFGILYGFQWPILIHKLSMRPGGPPKLRITGIEVPQPGFRPAEWIEETGRRLAKYCERFKVPFEFNAIASQNWESIKVEDLKVERNEVLAVNCMLRFKNLLDETVEVNCPRDSVLKLIRSLKPDIFVHTIINGAYNAPFFVTRFREALFHFSALYDVFDVNIPRENPQRLMFEAEFYGREAMNVIACEGIERVERAETYKQWQVRTQRAGLKLLPLDQELVKVFRDKVKEWYHKDFTIDQDSNWMLQGWKGRIVYASSCWVPA
ncbi:hypothetical protein ACLB2K_030006 [Fragaria x ananassa]